MMICKDCKFCLIHYDKKNKETIRCYKHFMKDLETTGEIRNPAYEVVTTGCDDFELADSPQSARTYHAAKRKESEDEKFQ